MQFFLSFFSFYPSESRVIKSGLQIYLSSAKISLQSQDCPNDKFLVGYKAIHREKKAITDFIITL